MQPRYNLVRQYEGASRYFAEQDHIITSKKLENNKNDVNMKPDQTLQGV